MLGSRRFGRARLTSTDGPITGGIGEGAEEVSDE